MCVPVPESWQLAAGSGVRSELGFRGRPRVLWPEGADLGQAAAGVGAGAGWPPCSTGGGWPGDMGGGDEGGLRVPVDPGTLSRRRGWEPGDAGQAVDPSSGAGPGGWHPRDVLQARGVWQWAAQSRLGDSASAGPAPRPGGPGPLPSLDPPPTGTRGLQGGQLCWGVTHHFLGTPGRGDAGEQGGLPWQARPARVLVGRAEPWDLGPRLRTRCRSPERPWLQSSSVLNHPGRLP